ncbi:MAG: EamA family transporter [Ignavibacteriaceae bacterium]
MILFFIGGLEPGQFKGNIFALMSGIVFAALFLGLKKNNKKYQQSSIFIGNIIVAIICIPFLSTLQEIVFTDLWKVIYLGVFQIAIAYAFFSSGLKRVFAVEASIISMVEPVLNPVWVFFGYGEIPSITAIIGGIIIITAITIRTIQLGRTLFGRRFN